MSDIAAVEIPTVAVLFLDLDGTVRHGKDELGRFVNHADDVVIFPEAIEMIKRWRDMHEYSAVVGITNQGGIALGLVDPDDVFEACQKTIKLAGMDDFIVCPHHPGSDNPALRLCICRKPLPGMIGAACCALVNDEDFLPGVMFSMPMDLMLMVGDRAEDRACAAAAGVPFLPAAEWRARAHVPLGEPTP